MLAQPNQFIQSRSGRVLIIMVALLAVAAATWLIQPAAAQAAPSGLGTDCSTLTSPYLVGDEASLNVAIQCFNESAVTGTSVISLTSDITLSASTTLISNTVAGAQLQIHGNGRILDGGGAYRPVDIAANTVVEIDTITIQNGHAALGGGGGIRSLGTLTLTHSAVLSNTTASGVGGGLVAGGSDSPQTTISNSTFFNNMAAGEGDAIWAGNSSGVIHLIHTTVSDNGDRAVVFNAVSGTVQNSVLANSTDNEQDCRFQNDAQVSISNSIVESVHCQSGYVGETVSNGDPGLGSLADNGGPTLTLLPDTGSPLIDMAAAAACTAMDQRGVARPQDGTGNGDAQCDIGAVEADAVAPVATMQISKLVSAETALISDTLTYTLHITNSGIISVSGVVVSDTLPAGLTFVAGSTVISPSGTTGTPGNAPALVTGLALDAGDSVVVTYQATVDESANGDLENVVELVAPDLSGNTTDAATVSITFTCEPTRFPVIASDAQQLDEYIACFNLLVTPGLYEITLSNDIALPSDLPTIANTQSGVALHINGDGFAINGGLNNGLRIAAQTTVAIEQLILEFMTNSAIDNLGNLTVSKSTLQNNVGQYGGGILSRDGGTLNVTDSLFLGNRAETGGGGLAVLTGGTSTVTNSTFDNNIVAKFGRGGGVYNDSTTLRLVHVTVMNNSEALASPFTGFSSSIGGGIYSAPLMESIFSGGPICDIVGSTKTILRASLVVENYSDLLVADDIATDISPIGSGACTAEQFNSVVSEDFNVVGTLAGPVTFSGSSDIVGADATTQADALADNGGATQTRQLKVTSDAIDIVTDGNCPLTDQRFYERDALCDAGAFERNGVPLAVSMRGGDTVSAEIAPILTFTLLIALLTHRSIRRKNDLT